MAIWDAMEGRFLACSGISQPLKIFMMLHVFLVPIISSHVKLWGLARRVFTLFVFVFVFVSVFVLNLTLNKFHIIIFIYRISELCELVIFKACPLYLSLYLFPHSPDTYIYG